MTQTDAPAEVLGPVDFVLIEFPTDRLKGRAAEAVLDLVDRGIIRLYDVMIAGKDENGEAFSVDLAEAAAEQLGGFSELAGARSGLLTEDDLQEAANALEPGRLAVLIVYENTWAAPFVAAAREAGGEMVASARIPAQELMAALDALDARETAEATS